MNNNLNNRECSLPFFPECIKIHSKENKEEIVLCDIDFFLIDQKNSIKFLEYLNLWAIDVQESRNFSEEVQKSQEIKLRLCVFQLQLQKLYEAQQQFYKIIDDFARIFETQLINETKKSTQNSIKLIRSRHRIEYLEWKNQNINLLKQITICLFDQNISRSKISTLSNLSKKPLRTY